MRKLRKQSPDPESAVRQMDDLEKVSAIISPTEEEVLFQAVKGNFGETVFYECVCERSNFAVNESVLDVF